MCVYVVCVLSNRTVRLLTNLYNESGCFQDPFLTGSYLCKRKEMTVSAAQLFMFYFFNFVVVFNVGRTAFLNEPLLTWKLSVLCMCMLDRTKSWRSNKRFDIL